MKRAHRRIASRLEVDGAPGQRIDARHACRRRQHGHPRRRHLRHGAAAWLAWVVPAFPASARLHRPRRRRRRRCRSGHRGRCSAGVEGQRSPAAGNHRRRRFPDGRHGAVDGRPLPAAVPADRREQSQLLQRRVAPGACRQGRAGVRSRTNGSASVSTIPTSTSRRWGARRARTASVP